MGEHVHKLDTDYEMGVKLLCNNDNDTRACVLLLLF